MLSWLDLCLKLQQFVQLVSLLPAPVPSCASVIAVIRPFIACVHPSHCLKLLLIHLQTNRCRTDDAEAHRRFCNSIPILPDPILAVSWLERFKPLVGQLVVSVLDIQPPQTLAALQAMLTEYIFTFTLVMTAVDPCLPDYTKVCTDSYTSGPHLTCPLSRSGWISPVIS